MLAPRTLHREASQRVEAGERSDRWRELSLGGGRGQAQVRLRHEPSTAPRRFRKTVAGRSRLERTRLRGRAEGGWRPEGAKLGIPVNFNSSPWVKVSSGNTIQNQSGILPVNGTPRPFIWGGNFAVSKFALQQISPTVLNWRSSFLVSISRRRSFSAAIFALSVAWRLSSRASLERERSRSAPPTSRGRSRTSGCSSGPSGTASPASSGTRSCC